MSYRNHSSVHSRGLPGPINGSDSRWCSGVGPLSGPLRFQTLLGSRSSFDLSSSDQVGVCVWRHLVTSRAPSSHGRQVPHHAESKSTRESIIFTVAFSTRKTPKPRVVKHSKTTLVSNFSWMRNPHSQEVTVSTLPHLKAGFHSADSSPATPRMLDVASVRRGSSGGKTTCEILRAYNVGEFRT